MNFEEEDNDIILLLPIVPDFIKYSTKIKTVLNLSYKADQQNFVYNNIIYRLISELNLQECYEC